MRHAIAVRWRKPILVFLAVVLAAVAAVGIGGCYLSDLLKDGGLVAEREEPELDLEVAGIGDGRVSLRITQETDEDGAWRRDGLWGLEWESGYGQVGRILEVGDQQVVREFFPLTGTPRTGEMARLDGSAFSNDPMTAFGLGYEEVLFSSPLGDFPAWFVDGPAKIWVIFVHGKGADRQEALRLIPTVADLGLPSMVITYRNDEGVPGDPSGFYRYGQTEWKDLEGAATYAVEHGAEGLVLVGYSMGGGIVTNFLYESPLSERVRGVILDAPMLDFGETVNLGAREKGYPGLFAGLAKAFAGLRFGVDWEELDYLSRVEELSVPVLLFHGDDDKTVPVETSDALAEARPDIVEYIRVAGSDHVDSWNTDRDAYETAVSGFLLEHAAAPMPRPR